MDYYGKGLDSLNEKDLIEKTGALKRLLFKTGLSEENIANSFAIIQELSSRILGLRHFHTQIMGGKILLDGLFS